MQSGQQKLSSYGKILFDSSRWYLLLSHQVRLPWRPGRCWPLLVRVDRILKAGEAGANIQTIQSATKSLGFSLLAVSQMRFAPSSPSMGSRCFESVLPVLVGWQDRLFLLIDRTVCSWWLNYLLGCSNYGKSQVTGDLDPDTLAHLVAVPRFVKAFNNIQKYHRRWR